MCNIPVITFQLLTHKWNLRLNSNSCSQHYTTHYIQDSHTDQRTRAYSGGGGGGGEWMVIGGVDGGSQLWRNWLIPNGSSDRTGNDRYVRKKRINRHSTHKRIRLPSSPGGMRNHIPKHETWAIQLIPLVRYSPLIGIQKGKESNASGSKGHWFYFICSHVHTRWGIYSFSE